MATIKLEVETHTQAGLVIELVQAAISQMDPKDPRLSLAKKALGKMDPDARVPSPGSKQLDMIDDAPEDDQPAGRVDPEEGLGHEPEPEPEDGEYGEAPDVTFQCEECGESRPYADKSDEFANALVCATCAERLISEAGEEVSEEVPLEPEPEPEPPAPERPAKAQCPKCGTFTDQLATRTKKDYYWQCKKTKCANRFSTPIEAEEPDETPADSGPVEPPPPDPDSTTSNPTGGDGYAERRYAECPTCSERMSLLGIDQADDTTQIWVCAKCGGENPVRLQRYLKRP